MGQRSTGAACAATNRSDTVREHGWCRFSQPVIWQGSESEAVQNQKDFGSLPPAWKVMLLSDGSVTRHLELMLDMKVDVDCIEMKVQDEGSQHAPSEVALIEPPYLQRQVYLRSPAPDNAALVYAVSWWNANTIHHYLKNAAKPIWANLSQERTELFRDIRTVYYGHCPGLEREFQSAGPFWGRDYIFWHEGQPLTVIHEVFSTSLSEFLGPCGVEHNQST